MLTKAVFQNKSSLQRLACDKCDQLGSSVVDMYAVQATGVQIANSDRYTCSLQDREGAYFSKVALVGISQRASRFDVTSNITQHVSNVSYKESKLPGHRDLLQ